MTNEEIRLLGQPIKINIPGKEKEYEHGSLVLVGGKTYDGYALCDIDKCCNDEYYMWDSVYIEYNGSLIRITLWFNSYRSCMYSDYGGLELEWSDLIKVQKTVTFSNIHSMILLLYREIQQLREQLDSKEDHRVNEY